MSYSALGDGFYQRVGNNYYKLLILDQELFKCNGSEFKCMNVRDTGTDGIVLVVL